MSDTDKHAAVRAYSGSTLVPVRCDRCGVVFLHGKVLSTRLTWGPTDCPEER
jgi:hypothetical protein